MKSNLGATRLYKKNGKYTYVQHPTARERLQIACFLVGSLGFTYGNMVSPQLWNIMEARASEPVAVEQILSVPTESVILTQPEGVANNANIAGHDTSPTTTPSELNIEAIIEQVFGDQAETAKKIAKCESGMKPEQIGDTHIMGKLNGEMVGDSIGLFQIRTGDAGVYDAQPWNRAKANGMSVDEFRTYLKNPENNVKYAKDIYDRQGWSAWFNCMKKIGKNK